MDDKAASVLARLQNKARETGRSYQLCLQLFCQEEFLRRVEKSKHAENFVLKGGLFVYSLTNFESRATVDVDFLLRNIPNTPEQIEKIVNEIFLSNTGNNYITFEIKKIEKMALAKKYSGIGANIIATIKNTRTPFGIDFGIGDVIIPRQEKRTIPTQLDDFEPPVISTYSLESTIAEKFDAILSMMEFSSRMKDYYDIYYLSNKFNFDGSLLQQAISVTFKNRDRAYTIDDYNQVMTFGNDESMIKKWQAFLKKLEVQTIPFSEVLNTMDNFLSDPYKTIINNTQFNKSWSAVKNKWE